MSLQPDRYLTTEEAAAYLKLKERKLYELAATGAVPCSKVTGKWLFPRAALDRWVEAGLARPDGFSAETPPPIMGGSHDLLLEWAVRKSGCGFALLSEGSAQGLERLAHNEVVCAAIHLHRSGDDIDSNAQMMAGAQGLHDGVLIAFARREQGLVLAAANPLGVTGLSDAVQHKARFGQRQTGAGAQLLLEALLQQQGLELGALQIAPDPYPTGQELAHAIRSGEIDCGIAARSVAATHGLAFVPLLWEQFDLAMRQRSYFTPAMQALLALMRTRAFRQQAEALGGYDVSEAGKVMFHR